MEVNLIQMTPDRYAEMLETACELGALHALSLAGVPVKEYYTRAELNRKFGRGKVQRMIDKLKPHSIDGGRAKYLLSEVLIQQVV